MTMTGNPTRRNVLIAAAGAPLVLANPSDQGQTAKGLWAPNDRIQVALIGAGGQGMGDARASVAAGAKLIAVADVYDGRLTRSKEIWGSDLLLTTRDYREVLARPDVDAIIIGTPDHWHQRISVDALKAGKHVYCEKPMVQRVADGHDVIDAARKSGKILQVGSQRVSSVVYQKAQELFEGGAIGELNLVEAWWDRNDALGAWQYSIPPDATPANIDWDRFLGRAPKVAFDPQRLFRWRSYRDYGTGVAGDLFVHLFSGMHFITGAIGPSRVYATGGLRFWKDGRDVPDVMLGLYDYPKTDKHPAFNLSLRVNFCDGAGESSGFRFIGSEGIMTVDSGVTISKQPRQSEPGYTIDTFAKATQDQFVREYREKYPVRRANADSMRPQSEQRYLPPYGFSDHLEHHRVFLEAIRSQKPVIEDATFGFRAAGPALLSNLSFFEQRMCEWDPSSMKMKG
jgi:predicted dehydrogenase